MARAYLAEKISQHQSLTPEGFLILRGQTICRSGSQEYHSSELGDDGNEIVPVFRSPQEVTSPAHIASLEGKPVTLRHPPRFVDSQTSQWSVKGHIHNVRVGAKDSDGNITLVADIFIYDATLIDLIRSKQLQSLSLGYKYDLVETEQGLSQQNLVANHLAIVERGRAGKAVEINDADLEDQMDAKVMEALGRLADLLEKMCDRLESDDDFNEEQTLRAKAKGAVRSSDDDDADYDDPSYSPNLFGTHLTSDPEGGEPVNPVAARDALRELRKLKPFIQQQGDRKAIDAYNQAVRGVKAEIARGEQYHYNPRTTSAYDAHLKLRRDADSFDASMARFHRKRLNEVTQPQLEHRATDTRELTFEEQIAKAKADCEARTSPKKLN